MRILITGGTGYLGAAIVRAVAQQGHTPIVFARRASASGLPGELVDGDVRDRAQVTAASRDVDAICHTAALVSIWRPRREEFDEVNVGGLRTAIEVCEALRIPRLVYTSSFLARPPAGATIPLRANDYQRTKVDALELARSAAARGVPLVSLVPGVIYGPGPATEGNLVGRLLRDHVAGRLPGIVGADRQWSFSFIEDVVNAHVGALTRGGLAGEYEVGGENAPQMRLFELVNQMRGLALPRRIPYGIANALAWLEEAKAGLLRRPPLLTRGAVEIFRRDWPLDAATSARALGYRVTPLEDGLKRTLDGPFFQGRP
jgi:nucleoside-diphosphate-sugar epimerase